MYKLTESDYLELYPYFTPEQIQEEFGERSHSASYIRKLYRKHCLKNIRTAQNNLFAQSFAFCNENEDEWKDAMLAQLIEKKKEKIEIIQKRIRIVDEFFNN